ncbi:hypothetical protein [Pseudorhodobacter aquimaris]|uniref:hypothetical protein n=1 Tax=Pseudorhodobacter aquimaris TaxID=687412 RepID=UPI00067C1567|nr:hypothetical protein [Pseudorhodobacter aquimaris]
MTTRTVDELLFHWRAVIGAAPKGFARNFALSIQKARGRADWQPSAKQLSLMNSMVSDLFMHGGNTEDDDEFKLIEDVR